MTSFNTPEEFLRALEENPAWKEAVRAHILGEELLQLPVQFLTFVGRMNAFVEQMHAFVSDQRQFNAEQLQFNAEQRQFNAEQLQFNAEQLQFNAEQLQFNAEQRQFNAEQRQFNETFARRLSRIEGDIGNLRGAYARESLLRDAMGIAADLGFSFLRILPDEELARIAQEATGSVPTNELRSFRRADLVIEATDGSDIHYIAVETSYTADQRDSGRAQRNARFLTEFTGRNAHPVIASVRNDDFVSGEIGSGAVYWHPLDDRGPVEPE